MFWAGAGSTVGSMSATVIATSPSSAPTEARGRAAAIDPLPLVGRTGEVAAIRGALRGLQQGKPQAIALLGEPGAGKSRLLAELRELAAENGCLVLDGRAAEFESEAPFGLLQDTLEDYLETLNARRLERLPEAVRTELAHLFPALGDLAPRRRTATGADRHLAFAAVRTLLATLAATKPLVLMLDDVHWADQASLELLTDVVRRLPRGPVVIAIACQSPRVPPPLAALVEDAARGEAELRAHKLPPLAPAETVELLRAVGISEEAAVRINELSGGNPFYALELARGWTGEAGGNDREVPHALLAALRRELRALPERMATFLRGAAVAGDPFDLELAAAGSEIGEPDGLALLDGLLAADLVRPTSAPRRFAFRHPIIRSAVYEATDRGWRIGAHARIAARLESLGASPVSLAHHVAQSARPGDRAAATLLARAAARVAGRAPAAAADWYEASLALAAATEEERLGTMLALGRSLAEAGRLEDARQRLDEALALVPGDRPQQRARLIATGARIDRLSGRRHEAQARLHLALEALPPKSVVERLDLEVELLADSCTDEDERQMLERGERMLAAAENLPDPLHRGAVAAALAMRCALAGLGHEAAAYARTASATVDAAGDLALTARLGAVCHLGSAEFTLGWLDEAIRHLERGVALARRSGSGCFLGPMLAILGGALASAGRIPAARATAEDAVETARLGGAQQPLALALVFASWVELEAGNHRSAHGYADEARELAPNDGPSSLGASAVELLATASIELGDLVAAAEFVPPTGDGLGGLPLRAFCIEAVARARFDQGDPEGAHEALDVVDAAPARLPLAGCYSLRGRAALALARGDAVEALAMARGAAAAAAEAGSPVEAGRCRLLAGRALCERGEREVALAELRRAHRELEACGAEGHRAAAARALRLCGERVARRARTRPDGSPLSERETQVAHRVAQGLTNKEIGAELHVSPKTVEKHLARVFDKLGIRSRAAVGAALGRASALPAA